MRDHDERVLKGSMMAVCSLPIHIPQCQKKWMAEEEKKPKKERRPLPPPPPPDKAIASGAFQAIDDFNAE